MEGCFTILGEEIHGTGGTINQYTGDGVMALFGAPHRLGGLRRQGMLCGAIDPAPPGVVSRTGRKGLRHRFQDANGDQRGTSGRWRHRRQSAPGLYTAIGDTTNLAARLQASAAPGSIHVSAAVADSVGHLFQFESMGSRRLKGISAPQPIFFHYFPIKTSSRGPSKAPTDLLGREDALNQLQSAWKQAKAQGPLFVSMTGPAGIGKRRLLRHFFSTLDEPDLLLLSCRLPSLRKQHRV